MNKITKSIYCSLVITILIQISVFAEPQLQYIEYWKNGTAYNSRNEVITSSTAYDYLTNNNDKFVKLNAEGKESARAAVPDELADNAVQIMGTAELSAVVPDGISNAVEVVLWDNNENSYTLTAYKDNNYIAYANIPSGTYSVFSAGIKDDFKGEYPAKCDKNKIVIEPSAAVKITVTVSGKQDLTNPRTYMSADGEGDILPASETPAPTEEPMTALSSAETKSLLKSTIITVSVLAILLLSYYAVTWYRSRKNTKGGE